MKSRGGVFRRLAQADSGWSCNSPNSTCLRFPPHNLRIFKLPLLTWGVASQGSGEMRGELGESRHHNLLFTLAKENATVFFFFFSF